MAEDTDHSEETADPLVDAVRQRQQPAWDALVTEVRPQLVGLAQRQLGSPDNAQLNAESIVQNALLRAWQKADQVQCDNRAQLVAWLGEIVRTTAVDAQRFRRRKKRDATREQALPQNEQGEVQVAGPSSTPSNKAMRNEEEQQLQTRLELLSVADRDLVRLRVTEMLGWAEIASRTGRTPAAAERAFHRAIRRMQEMKEKDP